MLQKLLSIIFCLIVFASNAQDPHVLQLLNQKINGAKNDAEKINDYDQLADYYSLFKLNEASDSILQKALSVAELSNDKELILKILFSNNAAYINPWNSKEAFGQIINFINKGLEYAQQLKRDDYVALAYIKLVNVYTKRKMYDEAMQQAAQAFTALSNMDADSIKCMLYNELGNMFISKGDVIPAYKNYTNAFAIAYKLQNVPLQSEIYHHFAELYKSLGNNDMAEKNLMESLHLNLKYKNNEGLLKDYVDLDRLTDDTNYLSKTASLANELNSERYKEYAKRLMFTWYMVMGKNSAVTLNYFYKNPTLGQYYKNQGSGNYYWNLGNIYFYGERFDSALYYYKLAESELNKNYDNGVRLSIFKNLAETYMGNQNTPEAKNYYQKAFTLAKTTNAIASLPSISDSLSKLYARQSDFKQAYYYDRQADSCNKLLDEITAKDKVVLLQVDMENKKRADDLLEMQHQKNRKYNLQIMLITIVLAGIFSFMLFIGMFKVSKVSIRMLGYFAFISLFEFIVLLIDPFIVKLTNGEPLKIWSIKIFLIAMLVPFQHFLEHGLIQFLSSRKLLELKQQFLIKRKLPDKEALATKAESATEVDDEMEEDTAVL